MDQFKVRLASREGRQLAFIRDPFGRLVVDTVLGREEHELLLGSGGRLSAYSAIGAPEGMPYWTAPGTGLLAAELSFLDAAIWEQLIQHPGRALGQEHTRQLLACVFRHARDGHAKIVGKELPLQASSTFVEFDLASLELWHFDLVTEQAWPRNGWDGTSSLVQVRIVSRRVQEEIAGQGPSNLTTSETAMSPPDHVVAWYAQWFRDNPKSNEDEAAHALRREFPTENLSRDVIRIVRRSVNGAPFRRGRKPGKTQADIGAADPRLR